MRVLFSSPSSQLNMAVYPIELHLSANGSDGLAIT